MDTSYLKKAIDGKKVKFIKLSNEIWEYAELSFQEQKSSKAQIAALKSEGFTVVEKLGGMDTAFKGSFGHGKPVIAILGEFDALPGLSQKSDSTEKESVNATGCGHGCGHQLLGAACIQAATAIKDYMETHKLSGTVEYYGCPAEEGGSGKAFMVREGCFKECDIALSWHPYAVTGGSVSTLANVRVFYNFAGISSHAAVSPHLGRSALDAVELMNVGSNYLREHIVSDARLHYAVTDSGGDAPNVVQAKAQVLYSIRAPYNDSLSELVERVNNVARGAALMTDTKLEIKVVSSYADILQNQTLDQLVYKNLTEVYPVNYNDEELAYAKKFYDVGSKTEVQTYKAMAAKVFADKASTMYNGVMADVVIPPLPIKMGSTDVGDVSWNLPTAWFNGATFAMGTSAHSWQATAQGKSSIAHKGMTAAAEVLAKTAIEMLEDTTIVVKAQADFEKALNGRKYVTLLPSSTKAGQI